MREDSDHFRHYVPLLRRIVIVVAVLAAIPVILWTITIFMRSYVGPPKLPTFRQLAASATVPLPRNASASLDSATQPLPPSEQSRLADASSGGPGRGHPDGRSRRGRRTEGTNARRSCTDRRRQHADRRIKDGGDVAHCACRSEGNGDACCRRPARRSGPERRYARRAATGGLDRHAGRCRARRGAAVRPNSTAAAPSAPRRHGADDASDCADATAAAGCRRPGRV